VDFFHPACASIFAISARCTGVSLLTASYGGISLSFLNLARGDPAHHNGGSNRVSGAAFAFRTARHKAGLYFVNLYLPEFQAVIEYAPMGDGYNFQVLSREILSRSQATDWETARKEWVLTDIYESEESETCLCHHFPIREICVIRNRLNGQRTEVGNVCVKRFLGIRSDLIFSGIKRIRKDMSKSLNADSIVFFQQNNVITGSGLRSTSDARNPASGPGPDGRPAPGVANTAVCQRAAHRQRCRNPGQAHIVREQGAIALCGSSMKSMQPCAPLFA
jgi:hypothetical protein